MSRFRPSNIKGTSDNTPEVQILRNRVTDTLRRTFESYGYLPIETPMLNYLELLTYKYDSDAEIVREIYKIRDQGERDLGLRFDLTVPFCKFIALNQNMKMPFKRYEIGRVWRNGPVKSGRTREFCQCDVDAVGIPGAHIEAEMISMAVKCFLQLGIEPIVKYNSRKLLPQDDKIIAIIDRIEKVSREETLKDLCKHMGLEEAEKLMGDLRCIRTEEKHPGASRHPSMAEGNFPELLELEKILKELGVAQYCQYTPSLARGLNIYTGTVFEIFDRAGRIKSALGGGGRYDNIIGNFIDNGKSYPAVGLAFGLEPIMELLTLRGATPSKEGELISLMLIPLGTESHAQIIADKMRATGKNVLVYLGAKNLAKAFEYAASYGIKHCAVVGPDEVAGKELVIKVVK